MTYQEIKNQLKALKEQNHIIPALNSKKEVLQAALDQILATIAETAAQAIVATTATIAIEDIKTVVTLKIVEHPETVTTTSVAIPRRIRPEHPALTEMRELARVSEMAIIWTIAIVRSLIRFSTPYLRRFAHDALRITIYAGVMFEVWLAPKIQLVGYQLALWAVLIAIRIKSRGMAIA